MYPLITLLIASSIGISLFALITYKMRAKSQLRLRKSIILIGNEYHNTYTRAPTAPDK